MATKTTKTSNKPAVTMADLLARSGGKPHSFSKGQRVEATIISKDDKSVIFDIGGKSEGIVKEKAYVDAKDFIVKLKVGDKALVTVLVPETRDGITILALRDAMKDVAWDEVERLHKNEEEVAVFGKGVGTSGIEVDVNGLPGFIPGSQIGKEASKNLQGLVGKYFKARVIEVDRSQNKVVLSEKEVSDAGDIKKAKEEMKKISEGDIYDGVVTTVANFGVFVEIKPSVEGLVHVSEISWSKVNHPSDTLSKGDKVKVKVLGKHDGKLSLSIKQAQDDPWKDVEKKYKVEDKVKGKVVRMSDFGAFVELTPGIEGLIHITKIPPTKKLAVNDEVSCVVEEVNKKDKRIALGLVLTSIPLGYK